ncbi:MAG: thermonuclease family protein [Micropepsaceae bacterium]
MRARRSRRHGFSTVLAQVFAAFLALGAAQARDCDVEVAENAVAQSVAAGALALTDGRRVRFAGIDVPSAGEPLAEQARVHLAKLVERKTIGLGYADRGTDRHGDLLAYVFIDDAWVQAQLIGEGFARVASRTDTRRCTATLLKREAAARAAKRGIWANAFYRVRTADELGPDIGTFQIVEGKVVSVKVGRERTYLNFGPNYRTDFTVTISARDMKRLAKEGIDPASWNGKTNRVRGWISLLNGPEIELTHAEQIEILP